jgi:hypothetical protein
MKTLLATIILALAAPAAAQPYVHIGPARVQIEAGGISDTASKPYVAAGWRFGEHLALEASYVDAGVVHGRSRAWSASGPGLAVLGTVPIGANLALLGKLGAYSLESESTDSTMRGAGPPPAKVNLGTRPALGIGVLYALHPRLQLRAMLDQIDGKGELERLRLVTVGAVVVFP